MSAAEAPRHIGSGIEFSNNFTVRTVARDRLIAQIREVEQDGSPGPELFTSDADPYQRRVITSVATTLRVIAPAGSGKTQTIANRARGRVAAGVRPDRILILTFDNSAATSLRSRFDGQWARLEQSVSTLNAFGYSLLREHFRDDHGKVAPEQLQRSRLHGLRNRLRDESPDHHAAIPAVLRDTFLLDLFGLLKNSLVDPRKVDQQLLADTLLSSRVAPQLFPEPDNEPLVVAAIQAVDWLFRSLDDSLHRSGLVDFDDQKLRAYVGLLNRPTTAAAVRARFDEIVVDEFQDINELDFALIRLIGEGRTLVVTGDDDQSIYGFRGTTPEFIIELEEHLSRPVESHVLEVNYRCPPNIVAHAVRLIEHNTRRLPKRQVAHQTADADIKVVPYLSSGIESQVLLSYLRELLKPERGPGSVKPKDVAILYRTNAQSLPLQVELILADIPYHVRPEDNILTNDVLERLLAILRVRSAFRANREPATGDAVNLVRGYFRSLRGEDETALYQLFSTYRVWDALHSRLFTDAVPKASSSRILETIAALVRAPSLADAMDVITLEFHGMTGMVGSLEDAAEGRAPLAEIGEVAANFDDADQFVATMERAISRAKTTQAGQDPEGIQLLTYFKSKGRQWHTVILISCNEGLIPHRKADLEEERRLFYVGLTRASKNLLVSYVDHAAGGRSTPSRFLFEAGLVQESAREVTRSQAGPDERLWIAFYPKAWGPCLPDIYYISAGGELRADGPAATYGRLRLEDAANEAVWAHPPDRQNPPLQSPGRGCHTLPRLLAHMLEDVREDDLKSRIELFARRHSISIGSPVEDVAAEQEPLAEIARSAVICRAAADNPDPSWSWNVVDGGEYLVVQWGGGVLARRTPGPRDDLVTLTLPNALREPNKRLAACLPWVASRLQDLAEQPCGAQSKAFREITEQVAVVMLDLAPPPAP